MSQAATKAPVGAIRAALRASLDEMRAAGTLKAERVILSSQGPYLTVQEARPGQSAVKRRVLNLCTNNYLGFANAPRLASAAKSAIDSHGYGMASVRFIAGTQDIHKRLERDLASFHRLDDAILFAACFDANAAFFEPLFDANDAIISDTLNHASIIDGIRLSKAKRYRYNHLDMHDLRQKLQEAQNAGARRIVIATDGVFSMGTYFRLLTVSLRLPFKQSVFSCCP